MTLRNWLSARTAELGDLITLFDIGRTLRAGNGSSGVQSARAQPRRALDLAQLEDRVMLSASPAALIGDLAGIEALPDESFGLNEATDVQLATTAGATDPAAVQRGAGDAETFEQALIRELVFVDTAAPDYQQLVDDLLADNNAGRTFEVVLLDADRDGVEQIGEALEGYRNLNAVHVVSHGAGGQVKLGNTWLSLDNVGVYAGQLVGWRDALAADADLLIYGCDLASNDEGQLLVESLSTLTKADVAASDDDTGHVQFGGDWELEFATGAIETQVAFSVDVQQNWFGLLADSDGDGLVDNEEDANTDLDLDPSTGPSPDTDGDTLANYLDADDDGDGIATALENADPNADGDPRDALDSDRDGQADYLDLFTIGSGGLVGSEQKISHTVGGLTATLDDDDRYGTSVAAIGDLDGNGVNDIAVGAGRDDDGGTDRGAVHILFLNADGSVNSEQKISDTTGGLSAILDDGDGFGSSVAGIGDIDGDGVNDIAVGAKFDDDGNSNAGAVYILFLNTDGTVKAEQKISETVGSLTATLMQDDKFGVSVANIGDLDSDGINDIVVGANQDDDGGNARGAVHILFLNADGTVKADQTISSTTGGLTATLDDNDKFGVSVTGLGDLDADGISDIAVGAQEDDDGGTDRGAVHVLFLNADGTVKSEQKISNTTGGLTATLDDVDLFGVSIAGIGDVDDDGISDIAVGAFQDDDGGNNRGAVHVLFLNADGTVRAEQKISNTTGGLSTTLDNADKFGVSVAGIGDLDGDGTINLLVGALLDDDGGTDRGAVYVLNLAKADNEAPTAVSNTGSSVTEGATHTITNTELRFDDSLQPASSVIYTVTASPVNGQLELAANPDVAITGFTQAQVDAGEVVYVHDGSATTSDEFKFDVADGQGNTTLGAYITGVSNETRLTNNAAEDVNAAWSPDGTQIAFNSTRDGNEEIYVMDADGTNLIRLTNNSADDRLPNWSPDGTQIVFNSKRDGNQEIYVMDADGSNQTRLTNASGSDAYASWSPDGSQIVFKSARDGNNEIYVMDADGSNLTRLTNNASTDTIPSWSPDGTQIAFTSDRDGNNEVYLMDADGSNQTRLTNNGAQESQAAWSPDGTRIAFKSDRDGNAEIYVINVDGTNETRVTGNSSNEFEIAWSPDGTRIAYHSDRDGNNEIYVADVLHENRFAINVTPATDTTAPTQTANTGSILSEGGTDTISNIELSYTDSEQPASSVTYTVNSGPSNGQFELTTTPTVAVTSWTQAQIDANQVVYLHNGSETTTDSITFTVDDGQGNSLAGQSFALTVTAVNDNTPTITSDGGGATAAVNVAENTTAVTTVTATDADLPAETLTYSISGGADAAKFAINSSTGDLTLATAPDFETPTDVGTDNVYDVTVQVSDGTLMDTQAIAVTVTDVNEAPVAANDSYSVDENATLTVDWWNTGWTRRQELTFDNLAQAENLIDFPVLVVLNSGHVDYSQTQNGGEDLRFFDSNGTRLAHEIEVWNEVGDSFVWVKVPQIDGASNSNSIWAYYGNAIALDGQDAASVWSNGYASVWHLNDDPSLGVGAIIDATETPNHGTATNLDATDQVAGKIGGALDFDGSTEYIRVASTATDQLAVTGSQLTIEAWVKRDNSTGSWMVMVNRQLGVTNADSYVTAARYDNPSKFILNTDGGIVESSTGAVPDTTWRYLTAVQDGTDMMLYSNGDLVGSTTGVGTLATDNNDVIIGGAENDATSTITEFFKGIIDEVRVANVSRSSDWIAAQYMAMENQVGNEFVLFGGEQIAPIVGGVMTNDMDADGNPLAALLATGPSNAATFTFNIDGAFTYTPTPAFSGVDSFTYKINDGTSDSNVATVTITVNDINLPPVITSDGGGMTAMLNAAENGTAVTTVTATDADLPAETLTYSISGGADAAKFAINSSSGVLTFVAAPDFETPTDVGTDNVYDVTVQVSDGTLTDTQTIAVTVTAVTDNTPTITSDGGGATTAVNVAENTTAVTTVTATDADLPAETLTYSISGGVDAAKFVINSSSGVLTFVAAPDFETPTDVGTDNVYDVTVQVSDGTLTDTQTIAVTVTPVTDNTPVITSDGGGATAAVNVAENTTAVTTVTATDADLPAETLTYSISGGADAAKFAINSSAGVLTFALAPDYETPTDVGSNNVYDVTVQVSDGTLTDTQAIAVTVTPVNDPPTAANDSETTNEDTSVAIDLLANDSDAENDTLTVSIVDGPTNGTLVFTPTGVVNETNLTNSSSKDSGASWSLDGTKILFQSDRDGNFEIYTMDADGSNVIRLTNDAGKDNQPSWSPDGTKIVFRSDRDGNDEIYVMDADGSNVTRLTNDAGQDLQPSWSPDDTKIAFVSTRDGNEEIYVMNADGSGQTRLTTASGQDEAPTWSPDGSKIAFMSERDGNVEIYVMNADGSGQTRLTSDAAIDSRPSWSPDGSMLMFTSDRDGDKELYLMDADGTGQTRLTTNAGVDNQAQWSPDGTRVLFMTDRDGNNEIYVADLVFDGTLTYVPDAGYTGSDSFTYVANDGSGDSNIATVSITVTPVNYEEVLSTNTGTTVNETSTGNVVTTAMLQTTDVDNTAAQLTYTVTTATGNGTLRLSGTALGVNDTFTQVDIDGGLVAYDHDGSETVSDSFDFDVDDGTGTTTSSTFNFAVNPVNDVPMITTTNLNALENQTAGGTVLATDEDVPADTFAWSITGAGADDGLFTINAATGAVTFNTAPDFEAPGDANTDNVYEVDVQVNDGAVNVTKTITVSVTDDNDAPVITTTNLNAAENQTAGGIVLATDEDVPADTFTWSITGAGADDGLFTINSATGALTFNTAPNFEAPGDANTDNVYEVDVQVNDGTLADTQAIAVTVTPVTDNTPVITSDGGGATASVNVAENSTAVTTVTATDADLPAETLTYSISGGADAAKFSIEGSTGVLTFVAVPDFESPSDAATNNVYDVTVQVSDGTLTDTQAIAVTVTPITDNTPTITSDGGGATAAVNVAENATAVTTVTATDADLPAETLTFSISGGADSAKFAINSSSGVLTFVAAPDYETPTDVGADNVYDVTVQVSDGTLIDTQAIAVTVTAVTDNAPVITSNSGGATAAVNVAENATAVTTVTATDADLPAETLTYSISGGSDSAKFAINSNSGVLTFVAAPDYETPTDAGANNVYDVTVQVSDGTLTDTQTIAVTVTPVTDNTPTITSNGGGPTTTVNVAENSTAVTTVAATDADLPAETLTYSISGGADAAKFAINSSSGVLTFVAAPDYETPTDVGADNIYDVTVQVSDGTLIDTQAIAVTVTAGSDFAPVITSDGGGATAAVNVAENSTAVTTVTATDADLPAETLTYSITGGADSAKFAINFSSGVLTFVAAPDFELPTDVGANNVYDVTVQVSDGALTDTQTIAVTVTTVNDNTPVITNDGGGATAALNVAENATAVTTVTATDADLPAETLTYSISGGVDSTKFTVNSSSGVLTFVAAPDYETPTDVGADNVYDVTVQVSDGTLTDTQAIAVTVTPITDNTPTITSDGGGATAAVNVAENATAVTTVTATDADLPAETLTFSISGGADSAKFAINSSSGVLTFVAAPDYETPTDVGADNVYDVTVQVSDGTLIDTQAIAVTVTAVTDNAPVITSNSGGATAAVNVAENATAVTTVTATDADLPAETLTYSISGGADAATFAINSSTGELTFATAPDRESPTDVGTDNVYDVTVQVSDGTLTDTQAIAVTVTAGSDFAPVITSDGGGTTAAVNVAENATSVTMVTATDADLPAETLTYSITGGTDSAKFAINSSSGVLTFVAAPDYETPTDVGTDNVYDVTVQVSDGTFTDTQAIAVTVTAVNDNTPTITSDGGGAAAAVNVAENSTAVTTVTATDADLPAETLTYSISGGVDATKFAINGSSGILTFIAAPDYESPTDVGTDNVYDVTVQVSDGALTDTQAIAVTVTAGSDFAPTITSDGGGATAALNVAENSTAVTTVTANDADLPAETLTYSISGGSDAARFAINFSSGVLTFVAATDYETPTDIGTDNVYDVTVQVSDGTLTDTQAIAVTVTTVNDNSPTITSDGGGATAAVNVAENLTAVTTVTATDADLPAESLTYSITGGADAAKFAINNSSGVLTFVAAPDYETPTDVGANNVYDVTVQVSDGTLTDTQAIAITVTAINDNTPTITSDGGGTMAAVNVAENATVVTTVTATDADMPADTLTYSITGGSASTRFAINSVTGALAFIAAPDFETPSDANADNIYEVQVTADDGNGGTTAQSISVAVTDVNETPLASADAFSVNEDTILSAGPTSGVLANDADPEAGTLSAVLVTGPMDGTLVLNNDGSFTYTPNANFNGSDTFSYRATDGVNVSSVALVTITVNSVNDIPVGNSENYTVDNSATLTVTAAGVLANDSDVEGDPLSAVLVSGPASGTLVLSPDGSFVYTPTLSFSGTVSFTYQASDGAGTSNVATATIEVIAVAGPAAPEPPPSTEPPAETQPPSDPETPDSEPPAESNQPVAIAPAPPAAPSDGARGEAPPAEPTEPDAEASTTVSLIYDTAEAEDEAARSRSRATQAAEEIARIDLGQGVVTVNPFFDTRIYWDRLNVFEQDIADSSGSFMGMTAGHVAGATLAFTAGYVVWTIKGGYLMASFLSSLPAWQSMDPLPILDANSSYTPRKKIKGKLTPDDEPLY